MLPPSSKTGEREPLLTSFIRRQTLAREMPCFLATRFATFSYRKALDFPMFQKSWFSAERLLRNAKNWIFIGYSFPAADFEFKYLLKRVQLSRRDLPDFAVVSGGDSSDSAYHHYQHFFGGKIKKGENFFGDGLEKHALAHISGLLDA
jgi:hypothetical protein